MMGDRVAKCPTTLGFDLGLSQLVSVSGNWRIQFVFFDGNAYVVDYIDYH